MEVGLAPRDLLLINKQRHYIYFCIESLPVTRHEQTPDFYRVLAILLEVNRLRRDLLSFCFPSFTVL